MKTIAIEWKTFDFTKEVSGRISLLCIIERGRGYVEHIKVRLSSVRWLCENLRLAARFPETDKLVRTKDEGDKVLVIHRKSNMRGRFVEISANPKSGCGHLLSR